jgi:glutamate-5-semialdehyde dehydrogenase
MSATSHGTNQVRDILSRARTAAAVLRQSSAEQRRLALTHVARSIDQGSAAILAANARDRTNAVGLPAALQDRLLLTPERVHQMVRAVTEVAAQSDPLSERRSIGTGPSGIEVYRQRIPLGVIAIVYEARPNVTAECAALALKSGNAVVLRGGKEAFASNQAIWQAIRRGLEAAQLPLDSVVLIEDPSRSAVVELLGATGLVDLVIPRGGAGLMALVDEHARVPVIRHGQGICHVYIDAAAELSMAVEIAFNAKVQRPGVCNAMETLLIHAACLDPIMAVLGPRLAASGVQLRADPASRESLARVGLPSTPVTAQDFDSEFQALILAIRTVANVEEALAHIAQHGTHHTAAIVTHDKSVAERFLSGVDASCVLWNASTRLNDGGALGLGAEMGISTSKMHAFGPMGATALTSEKFVVIGAGQVRV